MTAEADLEYRDIRSRRDPELLEAIYRQLFQPNFRDPDEQESPGDWTPRLWDTPSPPQPDQYGFVAGLQFDDPTARWLGGFAFVERYRESRCALLSYIAVAADFRRQGIAANLFARTRRSAELAAEAEASPVRAVFAEIHDPDRVDAAGEVIDARQRVRIMAQLGAMRVPIRYVQPALRAGASSSDRLMLITFPPPGQYALESEVVYDFLREYYSALGVSADDADLEQMRSGLGGGLIELAPLGTSIDFEQFGIALHFVAKVAQQREVAGEDPKPFESFEADLLSYRYVPPRDSHGSEAIFGSRTVDVGDLGALSLSLPGRIEYTSEGRSKQLDLPGSLIDQTRLRPVVVKASRTDFHDSDLSVFHLVLVNAQPAQRPERLGPSPFAVDEFDLVALSKLWQGGESWLAEQETGFVRTGGGKTMGISDLAREIFGLHTREDQRVRLGTVQLITDSSTRGVSWREIWNDVEGLCGDSQPEALKHAGPVKSLAGVLQGILDFHAVDVSELMDVFDAPHVDSDLVGMHKGTVLCVMESDRSYEAAVDQIGISPYLLFPQAVLLHNEAVLDHAEDVWEKSRGNEKAGDLASAIDVIHELLASYLPNVFHYPQEKWLFEEGEATRDLASRRAALTDKLADLKGRWEHAVAARNTLADDLRNALLLVLTFLPIYPFLSQWHRREALGLLCLLAVGSVVWPRTGSPILAHARRRSRQPIEPPD